MTPEQKKQFDKAFPTVSDLDSNRRKTGDTYADGYANGHIAGVGLGLTEGYKVSKAFISSLLADQRKELVEKLEQVHQLLHNGKYEEAYKFLSKLILKDL